MENKMISSLMQIKTKSKQKKKKSKEMNSLHHAKGGI